MHFRNFKIHHFQGYVQNNYIVEYKDKILIIDGASRPDVKPLYSFITHTLNCPIEKVKLFALTHCHPDHAGAAGIFRKKYNIPVAAPHDIDEWYHGFRGTLQHLSDTLQARFMARKMKSKHRILYYNKKVNPEYKLFDGSVLPFFDDWEVLHAPGHTLHNVSFYNRKNGILYISDTIIDSRGKFLPPVPVLFPELMKQTLLKIKKIKPEYILLAHGTQPFYKYDEKMIDDTIRIINAGPPGYIKYFYFISKFTNVYRKNRDIID